MGVIASGPPFDRPLCKCGWMLAGQCQMDNKNCGLKLGMPEYNREEVLSEEWGGNCEVGDASPKRHPPIPSAIGWEAVLGDTGFHTPYEFLPDQGTDWKWGPGSIIDLDKVCREVVEDLVKDSKSTQVGGTHYESMPLQPWEVFRKTNTPEGYCTYHINTVMAYLMRHDKKGGLVDLKKAADHLRELIRYFEEDEEYPF